MHLNILYDMIRKAKQTELSSVMQIWLDGNIEGHPFIPTEYWQKNADNTRQLLMASEIYVYETEESHRVVGFVGLREHFIGGLFVHTQFRTAGVGKALIDYIKMHKAYLVLQVFKKNETARTFYQLEGFNITKEFIDPDTEEEVYEMVWERS